VESTEMREACADPLAAFLETDVTLHEVRHQRNGYHTDLVFAAVDAGGVFERHKLTLNNDPLHDPLQRFRVWWYTYEYGPLPRTDAIENGRYAAPEKNRRHLSWLLDNGYVAQTDTDHVVGVCPPKIADLHAVELKRRDWETALEQAARANQSTVDDRYIQYKPDRANDRYGYADYRWVALDAGAIGNAIESADAFYDAGVGLFGIAEGGTVIKLIDAEYAPRARYTRDRAYAESQVWDQIDISEWIAKEDMDGQATETRTQSPLNAFTSHE